MRDLKVNQLNVLSELPKILPIKLVLRGGCGNIEMQLRSFARGTTDDLLGSTCSLTMCKLALFYIHIKGEYF